MWLPPMLWCQLLLKNYIRHQFSQLSKYFLRSHKHKWPKAFNNEFRYLSMKLRDLSHITQTLVKRVHVKWITKYFPTCVWLSHLHSLKNCRVFSSRTFLKQILFIHDKRAFLGIFLFSANVQIKCVNFCYFYNQLSDVLCEVSFLVNDKIMSSTHAIYGAFGVQKLNRSWLFTFWVIGCNLLWIFVGDFYLSKIQDIKFRFLSRDDQKKYIFHPVKLPIN
jgi:hypothetical protein